MNWYELIIKTKKEAVEEICDYLMLKGSGGTAVIDPEEIKEIAENLGKDEYIDEEYMRNLGKDVTVSAYFPENIDIGQIKEKTILKLNELNKNNKNDFYSLNIKKFKDEDWIENFKKSFKSFEITKGIIIKPSWEKLNSKKTIIELDPGKAFGTGTHETTRMCSYFAKKYVKKNDVVIDIGCGSGILSIIASKLGALKVTALDIDSMAVKAAKENAEINNTRNIKVYEGELSVLSANEKADIIFANIIADILIDLSGRIKDYLKEDGIVILSGIIDEREKDINKSYLENGYKHIETIHENGWCAGVYKYEN